MSEQTTPSPAEQPSPKGESIATAAAPRPLLQRALAPLREGGLWPTLLLFIVAPLLLLGVVFGLLFFQRHDGPVGTENRAAAEENQLAQARAALGKSADLPTSRGAVQQLNAHVQAARSQGKLPQQAETKATLQQQLAQLGLSLTDDDLNEVASPTFTTLDAHHLDACFLLRDAARSLDLSGPAARQAAGGKAEVARLTPLQRAEAAFAWVVRQVWLQESPAPLPGQRGAAGLTPPGYTLRRGSGTALERALVFLALLEQFSLDDDEKSGLQGVLIYCPDAKGQKRFWACGVTVGGTPGAVYLFDPRLGMPVPGPKGEGIATLADAAKRPEVLAQLQAELPPEGKKDDKAKDKAKDDKAKGDKKKDDKPGPRKLQYDVTPEQAAKAELYLATPLSALAPRMRLLQEKLLRDREVDGQIMPSAVRVRLAEDARATRARLEKLVNAKVPFLPEAVTCLRRFLPKEEGGNDTGGSFQIFQLRAVPWEDFPAELRDVPTDSHLGRHIRERFMVYFLRALNDPASPRHLMLRGRFRPAVEQLILERESWQGLRQRLEDTPDESAAVEEWKKKAISTYAAVLSQSPDIDDATLRPRVASVWGSGGPAIEKRINGAVSVPREAQSVFQLALAKYEQAVRQQVRLDLAELNKKATAEEIRKVARAWDSAENYWRDYVETNAGRPEVGAARRLRAEALRRYTVLMDGILDRKELDERERPAELQKREENLAEANRLLRETAPEQTDLEKLAHLLLARQLPAAGKK